jgi:quinol monooxygenase YgiN
MRGTRQRDDGWDEGRRDSWQDGTGYQPDTAAGYQGTGYPNGTGYAGSDNHAFQTGYGDQASGAAGQGAAGQGYGAQGYDTRGYGPSGYPDSGYPGSGQSAAGYGGAGYDSAGYSGGTGYSGGGFSGNGYDASGASGASGYPDGGYAQSGYAAAGASGQYGWASSPAGSEFLPGDESASENDNAAGTPRPYGRLSIFTLLDDKAPEFDQLAERAAEGVRTAEPDTLVYVIHVVPKAPMQRIIYEIYRDRAAFQSHEQQPHIQRFVADRRSCVLATNIIDLRLKYAKVAALATAQAQEPAPGFGQETQLDRVPAGLGSGDRYGTDGYSAASGQHQSNDRYATAGYQATGQYQATAQYQAAAQYAASGTGQSAANDQHAAPGAPRYTPASQYAAGNGQYGNGQLSSGGQYGSGQYSDGQYSDGQYSSGQQYSSGNHGSGQYAAAGDGRQQGRGRYPELGSGRQPDGGGRHAGTAGGYGQAGGYGGTGGYAQGGGQFSEPDQDTGTDVRTPRFEPAEWDRTASRAGRY